MLVIRRASEADIPTIRALAEQIWRAYYPGIISPEQIDYMLGWMYSREAICRELAAGVVYELACLAGEPVGFLAHEFEPATRQTKLHKIYLQPALHGRGLGRAMLEKVLDSAHAAGAAVVYLQVNKQNLRAIRAYERAGFRITQAICGDIGGGFVMDDYVMVREVPPHANAACDAAAPR
ncbi:MAG: GNAT family N-acetyltransferase [Verrucomicrobia bacterium]|nr:GNAT family N-acetyltransferase [Verrucomicrobiota bacterium]